MFAVNKKERKKEKDQDLERPEKKGPDLEFLKSLWGLGTEEE